MIRCAVNREYCALGNLENKNTVWFLYEGVVFIYITHDSVLGQYHCKTISGVNKFLDMDELVMPIYPSEFTFA